MTLTRTSIILLVVAIAMVVGGLVGLSLGIWKEGYHGIHSKTKKEVSTGWRLSFWAGIVATTIGVLMGIAVLIWGHYHVTVTTTRPVYTTAVTARQ